MEHYACALSDLAEKKSSVFIVNNTEVGIILLDDEVYAYANYCLHAGGPVALGDLFGRIKVELGENSEEIREYVDENEMCLVCPWHGYEYNAKTGECVPDQSLSLRKFATVVRDESVYIIM